MREDRRDRPFLRQAAVCAGLLLAVLAAYSPALRAGLIWNDADYLTKPALRSLHGLERIWFELGATEQYYPVLHGAFWLEHRLWGDAPFGYHLVNVLLHATAACLFGLVLIRLSGNRTWPWFAAFLFALHPVCVESVAWISEQKNTLSTVFYLLSAMTFLRWSALTPARLPADNETLTRSAPGTVGVIECSGTRQRFVLYCLATSLFLLALLSKSVTATLPAALLVILWWKNGRLSWKRDIVPLIPWFAAAAAMGLLSAWVERTYIGAQGTHFALTPAQRIEVAGRAFWFYLGKLVWPAHLAFIYPRWSFDRAGAAAWLCPFSVAAVAIGLGFLARRWRAPLAGFLFYLGTLFPTLGFFNVYAFVFSYVADHWQYLASLGVFAFVSGTAHETLARSATGTIEHDETPVHSRSGTRKRFVRTFHLGILIVLGVLTWRQCRMYRDVETLYRVTIERNPGSWLAHTNLGTLLDAAGRSGEAAEQFRTASRLAPDYPEIHVNLADALVRTGQSKEAIAEYETAIRLGPGYAPAQVNLANTLVLAGRDDEAIPHYRAALRLLPANPDLELGLGSALGKAGRLTEAAVHEAEALRLKPNFPEAEYELANTLANGGRLEEAIAHYRAALRLRPAYAAAHANLGLALATAGRPGEALPELGEALRLRPGYVEAHAYLGLALARLGRLREAAGEYRAALRFAPGAADVHYQLALVLRSLGETSAAAAEFRAAEQGSAP